MTLFVIKLFAPTNYLFINRIDKVLDIVVVSTILISIYLPWWPSCLDRGALNNVEAPGCGTSVV